MLLNQILSDIGDDKLLSDYRDEASEPLAKAVLGLVSDYRDKGLSNTHYRSLPANATGADLKQAIALMDSEDQISLIYQYNATRRGAVADGQTCLENPKDRDERQFRHSILRVVVYVVCGCLMMMVGAVCAIGIRTGVITGGPFLDAFLATVMEAIKILYPKT